MHPRLCQVDGSELYLCKDLMESVRREGRGGREMEKQLLFSQYPDARRHVSDK